MGTGLGTEETVGKWTTYPTSHLLQKPNLLMSAPHCSAWFRSWGLLRLARISPSFKRECSMAVQEADGEKQGKTMLERGSRDGPHLLSVVLPAHESTQQSLF